MIKRRSGILFVFIIILIAFIPAWTQQNTIGLLINEDDAFIGYTLFSPMTYEVTYLINNEGLLINSWQSNYRPGLIAYLLENGNLLRTCKLIGNPQFPAIGGSGGIVQEMAWDGTIVWEFEYSNAQHCLHHDIEGLPNGNVLMIAWEYKTAAEAIQAGRNPALLANKLWPDHIIEVEPDSQFSGNIVWEWHIWDHLVQDYDSTKANYGVVADHPELMNINFTYNAGADWNHTNSIDYNEELDQILLSIHGSSEIVVIDHSTTTAEAAGHTGGIYGKGGDFLYRWGNPQAYGAGTEADRKLFKQHDARWIESGYPGEGNILIFNNGKNRPADDYSSVEEIVPPTDSSGNYLLTPGSPYEPAVPVWIYTAANPPDFYSMNLSGAHRLPNGNTLICDGRKGEFFEITPQEDIVWQYINPVNSDGPMNQGDTAQGNIVFFVYRYTPDFPGFVGQILTPGGPIEIYPTKFADEPDNVPEVFTLLGAYPNPFNSSTNITFSLAEPQYVIVMVYDMLGRKVQTLLNEQRQAGTHSIEFDASDLASGVYFYRLQTGDYSKSKKMILLK